MAIAADCLANRREQEEVLTILEKIRKETGWRVGFLHNELKEKWGWNNTSNHDDPFCQPPPMGSAPSAMIPMPGFQYQQPPPTTMPSTAPPTKPMHRTGIINPLLKMADFSAPTHPYQSHYVAPNHHNHNQYGHY